nr:MAG TPA: hypothetical protein [Caudoviricetes sp.]
MTIKQRTSAILARIEEIKQGGTDEEKQDMKAALDLLGVTNEEETA